MPFDIGECFTTVSSFLICSFIAKIKNVKLQTQNVYHVFFPDTHLDINSSGETKVDI